MLLFSLGCLTSCDKLANVIQIKKSHHQHFSELTVFNNATITINLKMKLNLKIFWHQNSPNSMAVQREHGEHSYGKCGKGVTPKFVEVITVKCIEL